MAFRKLSEAEIEEEARKKREELAKFDRIKLAVELLINNRASLSETEQEFAESCWRSVGSLLGRLSEKQEKWLFDIAERFDPEIKR